VITSNLANMKNNRVIEQGVRRMKTRSAFLTLKVIYMMTRGATTAQLNEPQKPLRKETVTMQKTKRKVWGDIFQIMDRDGSGALSREELTDLIRKVSPGIGEERIRGIISAIDTNHDDNIDFDEFFDYVNVLSNSFHERPRDTSDAIFRIVDQDPEILEEAHATDDHGHAIESDISIKELQDICNEFGQELSPDDVYHLIRDIDEDGNGRLDKDEFFELLVRLNIVEEGQEEGHTRSSSIVL